MKPQQNVCESAQLVKIQIDGRDYEITTGLWFIYDLKEMSKIPDHYEFAEIKGCDFFEFGNNDRTHIKGGEDFKGFPKKGANS